MTCPHCHAAVPGESRFCGACGRSTLDGVPLTAASAAPARAHPEPAPLDALTGRTIASGRYKVLAKLGAGGMGTVFRAEQVSLKRQVALKVLDPALFHDRELTRRFNTEAELAAKLSHPNTVTLYDYGETEDGLLFIAMELIEGRSLRDVIAHEAPIAPIRAVDVLAQVAESLVDAHAHGIVHRDLKPDNVMLSERAGRRDFARVLDFGIAKLRDKDGGVSVMNVTQAGQLLGTPQYMSPEQILGESVDGRTDVYAMGVMLYEVLTGRPPFEAQNLMALLTMHLHDAVPPLESKRPGLAVPPPLRDLVLRSLLKKREARPPSMQAVLDELRRTRAMMVGPAPAAHVPPVAYVPSPLPGAIPPPAMQVPSPRPGAMPGPGGPMPGPGGSMPTPWGAAPVHTPGYPYPPPGMHTPYGAPAPRAMPPPERKRSLAWVWIILGLLLVAAVVAIVIETSRAKRSQEELGERLLEGLEKIGDVAPPSVPGGFGPATGSRFQPEGYDYWIDVPMGLSQIESGGNRASWTGSLGGRTAMIAVNALNVDGDVLTLAFLSDAADNIPAGEGGTLVEKRTRTIRGEQHVSVIYDQPQLGLRIETVLYARPSSLVSVNVGFTRETFDDTAALRDQLFRDRVGFVNF